MDATAIATVTAAVLTLTQLVKWSGKLPERLGPYIVAVLALIGLALWVWSRGDFERRNAFEYFAAWVLITTSAAGVYGFAKSETGQAITSAIRRASD